MRSWLSVSPSGALTAGVSQPVERWRSVCKNLSTAFTKEKRIDASDGDTGGSNPVIAPSIPASSNTLVLCFYTNKKNATYSEPTGTTEAYDDPNNAGGLPSNMMAYFTQVGGGEHLIKVQ